MLKQLSGKYRLLGSIMYGTGLRLTEAHQLRVKDVDFDLLQITVRDGKGAKDRWVMPFGSPGGSELGRELVGRDSIAIGAAQSAGP